MSCAITARNRSVNKELHSVDRLLTINAVVTSVCQAQLVDVLLQHLDVYKLVVSHYDPCVNERLFF